MSTSGSAQPRVPRYTEEQLHFLRSNLSEFEHKSQSPVRGDAKKFALDKAAEFIVRFGIPADPNAWPNNGDAAEGRFKEQIYNWFKNTVGRARRKLSRRSPQSFKDPSYTVGAEASYNTGLVISHDTPATAKSTSEEPLANPPTGEGHPNSSVTAQNIPLNLNVTTMRDAFLTPAIDASTLSTIFQIYTVSHPSPTPLTTVIHALFEAVAAEVEPQQAPSNPPNRPTPPPSPSHVLVRRFLDACALFPSTVVHASVAGPPAGACALQMQLRKCSVWVPAALLRPSSASTSSPPPPAVTSLSSSPSSMTEDMQRIAADRQRRKDYIQWARIHGAALELGVFGPTTEPAARVFSSSFARDAVWEDEEVAWVAGVCVLRSLIRTAVKDNERQKAEFQDLLRVYEGRWKEIRDDGRQELVTEWLLDAKQALLALDDSPSVVFIH